MPPSATATGQRLADLAVQVGAACEGDGDVRIVKVATLASAGAGDIAFLANPKYRDQLAVTRAAAVIVSPADAPETRLPKLVHPNPYATFARVAALLAPRPVVAPGVHASAVVAGDAQIAASASIGPHVTVGAGATIGANACINSGCSIGDGATIGADTLVYPNVTVYAGCVIGPRCILHAGAVIGADGFGLAEDGGRWIKIPQTGRVVVGADCEIGANSTIDRGALGDTVIEDDVKIDNQVQIGHNCRIGAHTAIAGCTGIAGSTTIGRDCKIGGAAMISGHLSIAPRTTVSGCSGVFDSITEPGVYTGAFPSLPHRDWQRVASQMRRLRELASRVAALERTAHRSPHEGEGASG
jgi:UDP-3-O-[3-hydroxymyristoyl] glucosamine N-acyltransferase